MTLLNVIVKFSPNYDQYNNIFYLIVFIDKPEFFKRLPNIRRQGRRPSPSVLRHHYETNRWKVFGPEVAVNSPPLTGSELCGKKLEPGVTTMININRFVLLSGRHWKQLLASAHARNAGKPAACRFQRRSFRTHPRHLAYAKELFLGQVNKVTIHK